MNSKHTAVPLFLLFVLLSAALLWPLPLHLRTALPGDPSGDLGVYVWNLWVFRHELVDHARLPLSTDHLFAYTGPADFSLHNYTPLASLIGMPLMSLLGVVATFNVVLILIVGASGYATYLLGRRAGLSIGGAAAAGALFIAAPVMTTREMAHFSLVSTAALPLFLWALLRTLDTARVRDAILVGLLVAVASYSDAYFGIYCVLMGLFTVAWRFVSLETRPRETPTRVDRLMFALQLVSASAAAVAAILMWLGVAEFTAAGVRTRIGLPGPMLVLILATVLRLLHRVRPALAVRDPEHRLPRFAALGAYAMVVCVVLMAPPIAGVIARVFSGRLPETEIFWRSSPRGVDLLSYFVPNPLHPWFGAETSRWFMPPRQDAFPEFVGSFSLAAFAVIALGALVSRLPAFWTCFSLFFWSLSLGPFMHVAGVNTFVPGPWAFLRYVPVIGMARAPSRFALVTVLGLSLLAGFALEALWRQRRTQVRMATGLLMAVLAFELLPLPRPMFPADVPAVYTLIASSSESGAVLELPTGFRDGTSSIGDFNASSQFYQTRHQHRLVGGYLSRISRWRKQEGLRSPMLRLLTSLSEPGATPDAALVERAALSRDRFLSRACVAFVVVNKAKASPELRDLASGVLRLERIHEDDKYELLRPVDPPPCDGPGTTAARWTARVR